MRLQQRETGAAEGALLMADGVSNNHPHNHHHHHSHRSGRRMPHRRVCAIWPFDSCMHNKTNLVWLSAGTLPMAEKQARTWLMATVWS
ncbi:uncharacterized protein P174DRAFT_208347 [Aspergillus novofumigatus IBT 16806]|uniref:Uncharacterized protein n=1 Tax=Aspergillus novofumigatus (strain IBT 16806) TaxID=1392255 RepID=A0A2I1C524_ASPN1|nr:uncharacterized protein P174DRAFT_208347 [Aspergillus novofumigatus IBT 16806]PKX92695.1 hypothetical protein P174DRAFT_208347 [Aspergillus novofumigatus IBT 16806]